MEGYYVQICRTLVAGPAAAAQARAFAIYGEALEAGIAAVKPGATAADVARAENDVFRRYGLGDYVTNRETRLFHVGRLDTETEGVILLTNHGELAHRLAHPRYGVEKTYVAEIEGDPDEHALQRLRDGIELDDGHTAPARARRLGVGRIELVLHEGRKHQVKRMLADVGYPVTRLHRSAYAGLTLEGLEPTQWRELAPDEVERLRRAVNTT